MARTPKPWYWEARGGWFVTIGGKRRRLAEGPKARSKKPAEQEFHRLMLAEGRPVETDRSKMLVRDLFDLYLLAIEDDVTTGQKAPDTLVSYRSHLVSASKVVGAIRAAELLPKDLMRWVSRPSWGPTHRRSSLAVARAAFAWGKKVGYLTFNPLADMELPRALKREAIPTREQVEAIQDAAWGQPFRDLLTALRETGCRPKEIATLTADCVDLEAGTWKVRNKTRHQTGDTFRTVYLSGRMIELSRKLVEEHPEGLVFRNSHGGRWAKGVIAYRFIRIRKKLGYGPECTAYAFRHLYITDALERGVNPATVAELVGHASLTMIMKVYNKLKHRTEHLRSAAREIRPVET